MNGMNGIIEPMEIDIINPSIPSMETEDTEMLNHCDDRNNTVSNHLDNSSSQEFIEQNNSKINESFKEEQDSTQPVKKNINNYDVCTKKGQGDTTKDKIGVKNESRNSNISPIEPKDMSCKVEEVDNVADSQIKDVYTTPGKKEHSEDEVDSEQDSTDEECEIPVQLPGDTVSINSESDSDEFDDSSQELNNKNSEVIILDTNNEPGTDSDSPEIQEIISDHDNDDCIVTNEKIQVKTSKRKGSDLRRSSRAIKKKRYSDGDMNGTDDSDIEEVQVQDPLRQKSKPIVINNTKTLIEIASKQKYEPNNQKKQPTVVIIDSKSGKNKNSATPNSNSNLCQTIVSRGTTVTSVSIKSSNTMQSSNQVSQPLILPSLTDDMFVVEAPSFIVPYVYEKPSVIPFKDFVDVMGKELDSAKAKTEEKLKTEDAEKKKKEKAKQESRDNGEKVVDTDDEVVKQQETTDNSEENKKRKKAEKKERRQRRRDDDDASWDGESSESSEDDMLSDEDKTVVIIKEHIEENTNITKIIVDKPAIKSDNYFECSLGKFFLDIGLNLVQGHVQNDLLKQQNRKLQREKKCGQSSKATAQSIASLSRNLEFSKKANEPFIFPQKKCEQCSFKSESELAMANHLETPHMKNNVYKCNFCSFEIKSPHDILYHMESEHKIRGRLERAPAYHQCANCPFEDNGKGKLARHLIPCTKRFKPEMNQVPPLDWEPPAKIPKMTNSRNMMGTYQSAFQRAQNNINRPMTVANVMGVGGYRPRGRSPMAPPLRGTAIQNVPVVRNTMIKTNKAAVPVLLPCIYATNNNKIAAKSTHQPSISITPLPRQPTPPQPQQSKSSFVICEICDGYIKDLEQLRNHMQWIHKVKIHPKMIYNRPPLNCQKCQFRFFTDQGLERHLLGSHGLVTSSMQEAANKGKDAGRCPVCGRVYQWKLLNHVGRDHNLTLKPAHLSYKCTVCTATFGMYKQFENHVYSAHSVVAKRVMDKNKAPAKPNESLLKPLKISDEITITPQSNKSDDAKQK